MKERHSDTCAYMAGHDEGHASHLRGYALSNLEETGLGLSDFAVLEALLHKGPLPVNVIGPKVNLTPGSISVAVERLVAKGLVSRVESSEDRRVRIVALTPRGKSVITPIFGARRDNGESVCPDFRLTNCESSNNN